MLDRLFGRVAAVVVAGCVGVAPALGQAGGSTSTFSYQGVLEENGEAAVGDYVVAFRVFDAATGGTQLCFQSRSLTLAADDQGRFSFDDLSCFISASTAFDGSRELWLEVSISEVGVPGSTTLTPRRIINASPFAVFAEDARFAQESGTSLQDAFDNGRLIDASNAQPVVIDGQLQMGEPGLDGGRITVASSAPSPTLVALLEFSPFSGGGEFNLFSASGGTVAAFEPDFNDLTGPGFMRLSGSGGFLQWDGAAGSGGSQFSIVGPSSSMSFSTGLTGDDAVVLPAGSVSTQEIGGEAGIAAVGANAALIAVGSAVTNVSSRTLTAPGPGTVVAIGTVELFVGAASGFSSVEVGVSETPTGFSNDLEFATRISDGSSTSFSSNFSPTVHSVFDVPSAGSYTYYLNVQGDIDLVSLDASDIALTLIYIPTAYGTVVPVSSDLPRGVSDEDVPARSGRTMQEIEAERRESIAANDARIAEELAALRARVERLEREAAEAQRAQDAAGR